MTPDHAYALLSRALETRSPECDHIDMFTADNLTPADIKVLKPICDSCDLALLCRRYATLAQPTAGFWAGRWYGRRGTR